MEQQIENNSPKIDEKSRRYVIWSSVFSAFFLIAFIVLFFANINIREDRDRFQNLTVLQSEQMDSLVKRFQIENYIIQKENDSLENENKKLRDQLALSVKKEKEIQTKYQTIYAYINSVDSVSGQLRITEELVTRNEQLFFRKED